MPPHAKTTVLIAATEWRCGAMHVQQNWEPSQVMPATGYTDTMLYLCRQADESQKKERRCGRKGPTGTKKRECAVEPRQIPEPRRRYCKLGTTDAASKRRGGKKKSESNWSSKIRMRKDQMTFRVLDSNAVKKVKGFREKTQDPS